MGSRKLFSGPQRTGSGSGHKSNRCVPESCLSIIKRGDGFFKKGGKQVDAKENMRGVFATDPVDMNETILPYPQTLYCAIPLLLLLPP
jgi:hypothetical protein